MDGWKTSFLLGWPIFRGPKPLPFLSPPPSFAPLGHFFAQRGIRTVQRQSIGLPRRKTGDGVFFGVFFGPARGTAAPLKGYLLGESQGNHELLSVTAWHRYPRHGIADCSCARLLFAKEVLQNVIIAVQNLGPKRSRVGTPLMGYI